MTKASPVRRGADRRNRDAEVIEAAVEVFYAKGYSAASIQDVADIVGLLKGSLYHYISSKEDLLFRIFSGSHQQALEIMELVNARGLPPKEHLAAYLNDIILWYIANVQRVSLYFNEWRYLTGENAEAVRRQRREFSDYVHSLLVAAEEQLRPDTDVKLATFFILGAINNIPIWYRKSGAYSANRVASSFSAMSCQSLFRDATEGSSL